MKNRKQENKKLKYNILEKLNKLPYEERKIAMKKLPLALKISRRTFERYLSISLEDHTEIPSGKLAIIATYLGCSIENLFNYRIPQFNTLRLKQLEDDDLAIELGFVR